MSSTLHKIDVTPFGKKLDRMKSDGIRKVV